MTDQNLNPLANGQAGGPQPQGAQLVVHKIYVKDSSFEAPGAPLIFQERGESQIQLQLNQKVSNFSERLYEVVLTVTVTCKIGEKTAYLAEVQQGGVFEITGVEGVQLNSLLATYCPTVLFPFSRQVISEQVSQGGFPPLLLQPINFDQIYSDEMQRRAEAGEPAPQPTAPV